MAHPLSTQERRRQTRLDFGRGYFDGKNGNAQALTNAAYLDGYRMGKARRIKFGDDDKSLLDVAEEAAIAKRQAMMTGSGRGS